MHRKAFSSSEKMKDIPRDVILHMQMKGPKIPQSSAVEGCECMLSSVQLCNPMDYSLLGLSVHRITRARMKE